MMVTVRKRQSARSITINPNVRCQRVYPIEGTQKTVADLKTIGLRLTQDQAIHLARVLLAVSQDWQELELTAYRLDQRRKDGTYKITITSTSPASV
jgi:hypothetical protein